MKIEAAIKSIKALIKLNDNIFVKSEASHLLR